MIKFLDLYAQYETIKPEIDAAIADVISRTAFISGKFAAQFEKNFADYVGVDHCVGVANGTDAIEIALEALDMPMGSEIIVPGNSFIASAEAVTRSGYKVVFADVDPGNFTLDPASVAEKITPATAAIIAVHLYGHPCNMEALALLAKEHGLFIIEDCAQAHGAEAHGKQVGTLGDVATFSFYPGKNLGAYGDAGAITTGSSDLAKRCRMIANHGRLAKYDHEFEGRNSRLDGLQAAILDVKLRYLPQWTERRIGIADQYLQNLAGVPNLHLPIRAGWAKQVYHLFVVRTERRDALQAYLAAQDIETGIHYPIALPKLKAFNYLNGQDADTFYNKSDGCLLSLPIGDHMTDDDVTTVSTAVRMFFN
jgi:dTDP-4-amino-4,6-dideoxygalactose transaminase